MSSWKRDYFNSAERSEKLRGERRADEKVMKGTFDQQENRKDKRKRIVGEEDRLTQALRNKGADDVQTSRNRGAMQVQGSKAGVNTARINAQTPYWQASANENNASAEFTKEKTLNARIANKYADKFYENSAKGVTPASSTLDLSGQVAQPNVENANNYQANEFDTTPKEEFPPMGAMTSDVYSPNVLRGTYNQILQKKFGKKDKKFDNDLYFN